MKKNISESNANINPSGHYRLQYILTLVITLALLAVIVAYSFGSLYKITKNDVITIGENAVSEKSAQLNNFLLKGFDVMQVTELTVSYMMKQGATSEEIREFLLQQSADYSDKIAPSFTGIYGVFNGEYIDGSGWVPPENYVPKERPWYTEAQRGNGRPVVVSPYLDSKTNTVMFSVAQMLYDGDSVISFDIKMDDVQAFAEQIKLDENGYGFVVDDQGFVVAHYNMWERGKNYLNEDNQCSSDMHDLMENVYHSDDRSFEMDIDGEKCIVFSKTVQEKWHVIMIVRSSDLFRKVQNTLIQDILLSVIIFIVVWYFCTSSYRNRMRAMHYADRMEEYQLTLEDRIAEQTEEIKKQSEKMLHMQENVIEGMATLIESRDGTTGQHVRNTKYYVNMIVKYMYDHNIRRDVVNKAFVENISNAAPLHDVGKIIISDTILNKPGRFTPEEFEIMKTHSEIGGSIVLRVLGNDAEPKLIAIASDVAHYHHEKWNGQGYPEGLKGEEIPLSARIMAVADVFDALVSKRVYKDAIDVDIAFEILEKDSGSHFDPELVKIFISMQDQIKEYLNKNCKDNQDDNT
ncbi:MAG: HD domain-containing phosphohydrolase [Porcipelethomonas sp.]